MRNSQLQHGQHQQDGEHHPRQRGRIAEFQERKRVLEQHDAQNIGSRLGTTVGTGKDVDKVKRLERVDDR